MDSNKTNDSEEEFMEDDIVDEGEHKSDALKKIRQKLRECESQKQEYLEGWQRTQAEMVNSRRLSVEREQGALDRGKATIIESLTGVLDSFDSAMNNGGWEHVDEEWRKGVEGIYTHLQSTLESHGLTILDPIDAPFDPHEHESVASEPTEDPSLDHTICSTFQKGYKLGSHIIRPAKVIIRLHDSG